VSMSTSSPPFPDLLSPATSRHGGGGGDIGFTSTGSSELNSSPSSPMRASPGSPGGAGGGVGSSSNGGRGGGPSAAASTAAVSAERKRALLLEARRDRLSWIEEASSPFRHDSGAGLGGSSLTTDDDQVVMALLGSSKACGTMKSAFDIVAALYGTTLQDGAEGWTGGMSRTEALQRMKHQLENNVPENDLKKIMAAISHDRAEGDAMEDMSSEDKEFVDAYRKFVDNLKSPECADIVQGMKHFVLSFRNMADALVSRSGRDVSSASGMTGVENGENTGTSRFNGGSKEVDNVIDKAGCSEDDVRELASAIHGYVDKTLDVIRTHSFWSKKHTDDASKSTQKDKESVETTKQVLETFVFAKCRGAIWSVINSYGSATDIANQDEIMDDKLAALQFVTPSHLDIHHLLEGKFSAGAGTTGIDDAGEGLQPWDIALEASIASLRSINHQHSPAMMLSCILGAYKGVNDALSNAMITDAGADDVLPTMILSVLRAKAAHIVSSLRFIDLFATKQQLRGEAGYAYTNLFGAVQFIKDLDFEEHSSQDHANTAGGGDMKVKGLTISPEEFRKGLEQCTLEAKKKTKSDEVFEEAKKEGQFDSAPDVDDDEEVFDIPASVVREARLRGEVVDVDWAQRWLEGRRGETRNDQEQGDVFDVDERKSLPKPPPLPPGFTRSYTFLSTKPEDVRVCDIPQLLQEYRMLVHASETLLAERTAKYNAEHKMRIRRMRDRLRENGAAAEQF